MGKRPKGQTDFEELFDDIMRYYKIRIGEDGYRTVIQDKAALAAELRRVDKQNRLRPIIEDLVYTRRAEEHLRKTISPPSTYSVHATKVIAAKKTTRSTPQRIERYQINGGGFAILVMAPKKGGATGERTERFINSKTGQTVKREQIIGYKRKR